GREPGLHSRKRRLRATGKLGRHSRKSKTQTSLSGAAMMTEADSLRARLARKPIVLAPGVYDAFTALVAEQGSFGTLYLPGAAIAYTRLGRSDIGLVSMSEVADVIGLIRDRVAAALIVAADTRYGQRAKF